MPYAQNQLNLSHFTFGRNYHQLYGNYSTVHTRTHIMVILISRRGSSQMCPVAAQFSFYSAIFFLSSSYFLKLLFKKVVTRSEESTSLFYTRALTIFLHGLIIPFAHCKRFSARRAMIFVYTCILVSCIRYRQYLSRRLKHFYIFLRFVRSEDGRKFYILKIFYNS